jgi:hypothetical protein
LIGNFSPYDFITNFVPGAVFAAIVSLGSRTEITSDDLLLAASLYFFYGVISSRLGSLVVQPTLEKVGFLKSGDYKKFLLAERSDKKLQPLLEARNFYRTLLTSLVLSLPFLVLDPQRTPKVEHGLLIALVVFSSVVMLFSLRKQTLFLSMRVEHYSMEGEKDAADRT